MSPAIDRVAGMLLTPGGAGRWDTAGGGTHAAAHWPARSSCARRKYSTRQAVLALSMRARTAAVAQSESFMESPKEWRK